MSSEAGDSRRLFLTFLHCLYEADRSDLQPCLTKYSAQISLIFYRLSVYNINVVFHSIVDIARLSHSNCTYLNIGYCELGDHKVESAVEILIKRASLNYQKYNQCISIALFMPANHLTHKSVRSLAKLITAEGIELKILDISYNLLTQQSSALETLKTLTEAMSSARGVFLHMLSMMFCGFTSRHAYHLVLLLRQNINHVCIGRNDFCESVPMLVAAVRETKKLNLCGTSVTDKELIQVGIILLSNTCLKELSIGFSFRDEPSQPKYLTPEAVCEFIKLITSRTSRSELSHLSIPECYMNAVESNEQVQIALKTFSLRRCYPLEIVKFQSFIKKSLYWMDQLKKIPDSLLYGNK